MILRCLHPQHCSVEGMACAMVSPLTAVSKDLSELLAEFRASVEAAQQHQRVASAHDAVKAGTRAMDVNNTAAADDAQLHNADKTIQDLQGTLRSDPYLYSSRRKWFIAVCNVMMLWQSVVISCSTLACQRTDQHVANQLQRQYLLVQLVSRSTRVGWPTSHLLTPLLLHVLTPCHACRAYRSSCSGCSTACVGGQTAH